MNDIWKSSLKESKYNFILKGTKSWSQLNIEVLKLILNQFLQIILHNMLYVGLNRLPLTFTQIVMLLIIFSL